MRLYRVFPHDPKAAANEVGGALYRPIGGNGRIDNPRLYRTLYVCDTPEGAVAEAFGRFSEWRDDLLVHPSGLRYALAQYVTADGKPECDLDSPGRFLAYKLRPSQVVARDRAETQSWARSIYESKKWSGVAWWSYYNPAWKTVGLWSERVSLRGQPQDLQIDHSAVRDAASAIVRSIAASRRRS